MRMLNSVMLNSDVASLLFERLRGIGQGLHWIGV